MNIVQWAAALPLPLAFAGILWIGGGALIWLARGRSPVLVVFGSPIVAVVLVGGVAVAQMWFEFAFGWAALAVAFVVAAVIALTAGLLAGRTRGWWSNPTPGGTDERDSADGIPDRPGWAECASILVGSSVLGLTVLWLATDGRLDLVSQTWDAIFDANAVRFGFETSNVAPTHLTTFPYPDASRGSYYPATFHALCVLYMQLAGTNAVVPTNVVAGLVGGALWPSAAVLGATWLMGSRRWVLRGAAVLAWGFYAAPWSALGWGVLWATSMAGAVSAIALAGLAQVLGWGLAPRPWRVGLLVTGLGMCLLGFMHPRVLVIFLVLAVGLWCWTFGGRALRARRAQRPWRMTASVALAPVVGLIYCVLFVARGIEAREWLVDEPLPIEMLQHLANGVTGSPPQLITAALVLVGAWLAVRRGLSGLVVLWLGVVALDVITATMQGNFAVNGLARFWYNDRHRVLPLTAFPALVLALVAVQRLRILRVAHERAHVRTPQAARARRSVTTTLRRPWVVMAVALLIVANGVVAAVAGLRVSYAKAANDPKESLVSPEEIALYRTIADIVPKDERIMNNANDGSALLYAYVDRRPIFLVAGVRGSTYNSTSAFARFNVLSRHDFCVLVHEDHLGWLYDGGRAYSRGVILEEKAPGLKVPPGGHWALTKVLSKGGRTLYKITGCGPLGG